MNQLPAILLPGLLQRVWQVAVDWNRATLPDATLSLEEFVSTFKQCPSTALGPNGFSYPIIKKSARLLAPVLVEAFEDMCDGVGGPDDWQDSRLVFIPKFEASVLQPYDVRPLSCTNIGVKIVNRAVAWRLLFDLERVALQCARDHPWAGILFTDLAQAFPYLPSAQFMHWGGEVPLCLDDD
eukprot:4630731-Amphidinium_carterae.1